MTDDDKTIVMHRGAGQASGMIPGIRVTMVLATGERKTVRFVRTIRIGREAGNDVCLSGDLVSRHHAEIGFDGTQWRVRDLGSSNGTYLDGTRIQDAALSGQATLQFGVSGPALQLLPEAVAQSGDNLATSLGCEPAQAGTENSVSGHPALIVTFRAATGKKYTRKFTDTVTIGRDESCSVVLRDASVSRVHAEIFYSDNTWSVRDLGSQNATLLDGKPVEQASLPPGSVLQLGHDGPQIQLQIEGADASPTLSEQRPAGGANSAETVDEVARHYFEETPDHQAGEHTIMVRRAFKQVKKRQSRVYSSIIAVVAVFLLGSLSVGVYQYQKLQKAQKVQDVAVEMFYNMKTIGLQVANIEKLIRESGETAYLADMDSKRSQMAEMEQQYDRFLEEFGVMDAEMSEEDRLIMRMARLFGECELTMPKDFIAEVKKYIDRWKMSNRLEKAITRIHKNGYASTIYEAMIRHHMPPQFMYLALQESNFNLRAVGPKTRFGIAKGVWQFIPGTARDYGLRTGPLVELAKYDPRDDRFNFNKATHAAARFLRDIYSTDAQASGLLVMASYNWGPTNIKKRIRQMPENPRERNFWKLLEQHRIPKETYDYVFYIFSAAVIGENPQLFGFDFENPLAEVSNVM